MSNNLKAGRIRVVVSINRYYIMPVNFCPALNAGPDGGNAIYAGFFFNGAGKRAANNTFMNESVAGF